MLRIKVLGQELYNEVTNEFTTIGDVFVDFEHSLVSLSKWEALYEKPFLGEGEKTSEEIFSYIQMMVITPEIPPEVFSRIDSDNLDKIKEYIDSKQSATTFRDISQKKGSTEIITSELIYYWMVASNIPLECETWHLNRLFSLIRICGIKNSKPQKMTKREIIEQQRALNAERRAKLGTTG